MEKRFVKITISLEESLVPKLDHLATAMHRDRSKQIAYLIDREYNWLNGSQSPVMIQQPIEQAGGEPAEPTP